MCQAHAFHPEGVLTDRRRFLASLIAAPVATGFRDAGRDERTSMYLAYTSFAVRLAQGRNGGSPLDARAFLQLCTTAGAGGGQIDASQLPAPAGALAAVHDTFRQAGVGLEISLPSSSLESPEAWARAVALARGIGATRARVALLSGRRYERFETMAAWAAFSSTWRDTLARMRPAFEQQRFPLGIENHKDWLAPELVALLRMIDSEYVGACVDFGNNLALLEDPDETIALLAPFAITTHLKDMAVRRTADGFELSEVPLGTGILPLPRYIEVIRRARPDVHFCLEMMTRDPLSVPYRTDRYWVTLDREARRAERLRHFEDTVLSRARADLPRLTGLTPAAQTAAEDDNVRACVTHARDVLHLEAD